MRRYGCIRPRKRKDGLVARTDELRAENETRESPQASLIMSTFGAGDYTPTLKVFFEEFVRAAFARGAAIGLELPQLNASYLS
jgi:hypothetical protein